MDSVKKSEERTVRPIEEREINELKNLKSNYERNGKTEGSTYTLFEVNRELLNRKASNIDGKEIVNVIVKLAKLRNRFNHLRRSL